MVARSQANTGDGVAADPLQSGIDRKIGGAVADAGASVYIPDADSDGNTYGRKDGGWTAVATSVELADHLADTVDAHDASAVSYDGTSSGLAATEVQAAIDEVDSDLDAHIADTSAAHAASAIGVTPAGTIASTDVQAALAELDGDITDHVGDATAAHAASAIGVTPAGNLAATDAQSALTELQTDVDGRKPFLGVGNRDSLSLSYDPATRKITITGAAEIWIAGVKTTLSNPYVFGAHDNTTGGYFFYFDENGDEAVGSTAWDLTKHAPIAYVFYSASLADGIAFYELHSATRDPMLHRNLHATVGTKAASSESSWVASGYVLNSDANADKTLAIASGTVWDEDINRTATAVADGGPYFILYRSGASGTWTWTDTATFPFLDDGTNLYYNENTGATWQLTALNAGTAEYMNMWVFATTALESVHQIFFIVGQVKHATEAAAFAASLADISWGNVPFQEIAPLYQITFRRSPSNSNQGKADIRRVARIVGSYSSIAVTGTAATTAAAVSFVPSGTIAASNVQTALEELDSEKLAATSYTASDVLSKLLTVDGASSLLDADLLDGQEGTYYAPLASPTFTGTPAAPTAAADTNTTQIATTAFVIGQAYAKLASPTFTGQVTVPAGSVGTPGIGATGDGNTGIYFSAADTIDFAAGGVRGFQIATAASAVNYLIVTPAAASSEPSISAAGTDTDINVNLTPKGAGVVLSSTAVEATTYVKATTYVEATTYSKAKQFSAAEYDAGNSSTSITIDGANGQNQKMTLTGNVAVTLSNPVDGETRKLKILTGAGSFTVTFSTTVKWPGGTAYTATTDASKTDFVTLYYDGSAWWGQFAKDFS